MASDDSRLIDQTLTGNTEAFGELVLRYQDRLYCTLVHLLGSVHDARDVVQDAFLLAFQKLHTFRKDASFYSWLFRIAYNVAVTNRRKIRKGISSLSAPADEGARDVSDPHPESDPSRAMQTSEISDQVQAALEQLAPEYKDALILKEIEGFQYEEISTLLNCPVGTVRSRIHRARQLLRERLARVVEREQK
ncbi:RNA polymerase sigma factor [Planctomicrobium sp. SH527]|uniref:RNA polymerase sigma factor n=1 Tax=Planctomicrobium sp. SH527 TaxID=3448123 RepID=UPI003F5B6F71